MATVSRLVVPSESGRPTVFELSGPSVLIGRGREVDLPLEHESVSRFHARLERTAEGWRVVDLASSNGTFVAGRRVTEPTALSPGTRLRCGAIEFEYAESEPRSAMSRSAPWLVASAIALVVLGLLAFLYAGVGSEPTEVDGPAASPHTTGDTPLGRDDAGAPPASSQSADGGSEGAGASGAESGEDPDPEDRSSSPSSRHTNEGGPGSARRDPENTLAVRLADGSELRGQRDEASTPAWLMLVTDPSRPPRRIARERIVAIDGRDYEPDLEAIFAARRAEAVGTEGRIALARWCQEQGLGERANELLRQVLSIDSHHPEARALLGEVRYLGTWKSRDHWVAEGVIDPETGVRLGRDGDLRALQSLWIDALGRPPLPEELKDALDVEPERTIERLLSRPELWVLWGESVLRRTGLDHAGSALRGVISSLAEDLAVQLIDFREAFRELALSEPFRQRFATDRAYAEALLVASLGAGARQDEPMIEAASNMIRGDRAAVLGDRGESAEELVSILLSQPNLYRIEFRREARRMRRKEPGADKLRRGAMRLAIRPNRLREFQRQWLLESFPERGEGPRRERSREAIARGIWGHLIGRPPDQRELAGSLALARGLGSRELFPGTLARWLLASDRCRIATPGEADRDAWAQRRFARILGRRATDAELASARERLERAGAEAFLLGLVSSDEARTY